MQTPQRFTVLVSIKRRPYRPRRDARPWIALLADWPVGQFHPTVARWGAFVGTPAVGGTLQINANPGDIVRWGSLRNVAHPLPKLGGSAGRWYGRVRADGTVEEICSLAAKVALRERS